MSEAVVVTGLGVAAPNGLGLAEFWPATLRGENGIRRITRFDPSPYSVTLAGEVPGFDPHEHLPGRLIPQLDRMTQLSLTATDWALADAGVVPGQLPEYEMGVITAASAGGFEFGQRELEKLCFKGNRHVSAYQSIAWFYAVNTGQISIRNGMKGPSGVVVSDQAGGGIAVAQARRQIRCGSRVIVSGGVDGALCSWGLVAQWAGGELSEAADPGRAYLPFDARACGHVPGEGGAILILEDAGFARSRGAPHVYAEIAGCAATFDPPERTGRGPTLRRAIELALADACVTADDVGVVFADGMGLPARDRAECEAITAVFGARGVPVTVPKTMTGRLCAGGAPLDIATALLAMRDSVIPPTVNVTPAPGYEIDLVTGPPRKAALTVALVLARGRGGFNSAVLLRAV